MASGRQFHCSGWTHGVRCTRAISILVTFASDDTVDVITTQRSGRDVVAEIDANEPAAGNELQKMRDQVSEPVPGRLTKLFAGDHKSDDRRSAVHSTDTEDQRASQ